jgi:hypothetical protein
MPNWCHNRLYVSGSSTSLRAFQQQYEITNSLVESFVPLPPGSVAPIVVGDNHLTATTFTAEGHKAAIHLWGTKWGDCDTCCEYLDEVPFLGEALYFTFDTAWSPMLSGIKNISLLFSDLLFTCSVIEEQPSFIAYFIVRNGKCLALQELDPISPECPLGMDEDDFWDEVYHPWFEDLKDSWETDSLEAAFNFSCLEPF